MQENREYKGLEFIGSRGKGATLMIYTQATQIGRSGGLPFQTTEMVGFDSVDEALTEVKTYRFPTPTKHLIFKGRRLFRKRKTNSGLSKSYKKNSEITDSPFTICAECKWFQSESDSWHGQFCGNPRRRKKETIDFVSGKRSFSSINDLGQTYITQEERPYARDINTDGMCETFESKK